MSTYSLPLRDWNPSDCILLKHTANKGGLGQTVRVNSNQSKRWLTITVPKMMTWGVSEYIDPQSGKTSFTMSLQFEETGVNPESDELFRKLTEYDEYIIDRLTENSALYWEKPKSKELVREGFTPSFKYPNKEKGKIGGAKDYTKRPTLSAKIPVYLDETGNQKWSLSVYKPGKPAPKLVFPDPNLPSSYDAALAAIPKMSSVKTIIEGKIWLLDKTRSGVIWTVKQVFVVGSSMSMKPPDTCQFEHDSGDEACEEEEGEADGGGEVAAHQAPVKAVPILDDETPSNLLAPNIGTGAEDDASTSGDDKSVYSTDYDEPHRVQARAEKAASAPVAAPVPVPVPVAVAVPAPAVITVSKAVPKVIKAGAKAKPVAPAPAPEPEPEVAPMEEPAVAPSATPMKRRILKK